MNRLLIVDDSNLLFQIFYGIPSRSVSKQGKTIHGALGFIGALLKIIRKLEPTHIAVLFDSKHENNRSELNAAYKANRMNYSQLYMEETPFSKLPDIYAALDYLEIQYAETRLAKQTIVGYALTYGQENEIVISCFDSDFFS